MIRVCPLKRYMVIATTLADARRVCFVDSILCFVEREGLTVAIGQSPVTLGSPTWRLQISPRSMRQLHRMFPTMAEPIEERWHRFNFGSFTERLRRCV